MKLKNDNSNVKTILAVFIFLMMGFVALTANVEAHEEEDDDDSEWEDYSAAELVGIGIFIILLGIVVIFVGLWIYRDANKRGLEGTLWLIVLFVGNVIGLIIYFIIRKEHPVRTFPQGAIPQGTYSPETNPMNTHSTEPTPQKPIHSASQHLENDTTETNE